MFWKSNTSNHVVHKVTLHETINKTPVETTHLTAHPSSAGVSYISVIMSPTCILVHWQMPFLTIKVPVSRILFPQEPRTEISHCLWDAHMMDASVYLRSQVIYLHRGTNDQRKRTSNHSSTPFHTYCISQELQAASLMKMKLSQSNN